ncbi:MAG: restriction endonuclease subunit S [Muribaculaceae bacterium]|nr:restriction endonuclease subunit S [Muribaculaceae bacterium]
MGQTVNLDYRLDASAYNGEALAAISKVRHYKDGFIPLWGENGIISNAFVRGRFKRIYTNKETDIPFFLPSDIENVFPKATKHISQLTRTNLDALRVSRGMLLMSCSGTIGKSTIVSKYLHNQIFSHDLLRITFNKPYDLGYTYAFVNTLDGLHMLQSNNYGAVIDHIEPDHLRNIIIPNASVELRQEIHNLILQSFELRDRSNELIENAQKLLFNELSLPHLSDIEPKQYNTDDKFRCISISASRLDGRIDVSYHVPEVEAIIDILQNNASRVLKIKDPEISSCIILPGRFKRVYVDKEHGVPFFGGKQLLQLTPSSVKYISRKHHAKNIKELTVRENMCVISRSGTIGKVNIIPKHWDGWALSEHIIRILPSSNDIAGYIYAWLSSPYCKMLILRNSYGAVIDELSDDQIGNVRIPILKDTGKMKMINDDILYANHLRYEAALKEEEALIIMQKILDNEI